MNIALIDDSKEQYIKYKSRLERRGLNLIFLNSEDVKNFEDIVDWILSKEIEFVLVDYKLDQEYDFTGSRLIQHINNAIPDLTCVLFTSNNPDDNLVTKYQTVEKSVFNSTGEEFDAFIDNVKQAIDVFENRRKTTLAEYQELKSKMDELNEFEKERMKNLYKTLFSYGIVERVPDKYFESDLEKRIDCLIMTVEKYINEEKK